MIINKKILGELLLAAGYGKLTAIRSTTAEDFDDFEVEVECAQRVNDDRDTFAPAEVLEVLQEKFYIASNIITIDMCQPNTHHGVTLETISHKEAPRVKKTRQLKRLGQLKGLTIESIKTVKQGTKAYVRTTDGAGICIEHAIVVQDLHPDENIALGLLTKEDLASIAKAKKMGLI